MKLPKIPEATDKPKSFKESLYTSTPVILTVIATVLAGLSSSELTRSQYFRALASQNQAKASDQWGYFQSKKLRAADALNTLDLLAATSQPSRLDPANILHASQQLCDLPDQSKEFSSRTASLDADLHSTLSDAQDISQFASVDLQLPTVTDKPIPEKSILDAMNAVNQQQTETQMAPILKQITDAGIDDALQIADANLKAFDLAVAPMGTTLDKLHSILAAQAEISRTNQPADPAAENVERAITSAQTNVTAARLRYSAARYEGEAKYNGVSGQLYEVQVRQNGLRSDRHHARSANFFYGMLAAQGGVTIATLSLAVRRKSIFWSLAAVAGAFAVGFSGFIYLFT